MREVYLDHAATTPPFPEVLKIIQESYTNLYGNASSLHSAGQKARQALEKAREEIAKTIGAEPEEIFFTSGGTESDNLALFGTESFYPLQPVITSIIEHEAVLETVNALASKGHPARFLPVNNEGIVDLKALKALLVEKPYVVSVMLANNEIGTIQPLREIAALAHEKGALVHTDAVQALGKIAVNVQELGVDMLSASAHKFYGPKGIGFFYLRKDVKALPLFQGGGHERGLRSGTENVPDAIAMALALKISTRLFTRTHYRYDRWTAQILKKCEEIGDFRLNGHPKQRVPGLLSLSFKYINGEALMELLDMNGIAVSTASACQSHSAKRGYSHVIKSLGIDETYANGTIRVSMGVENTQEEIDFFCEILKKSVKQLRNYRNDQ
ncbi:MAG: cysteine desulfurase [Thermotogae bacterium]|nr:cysteine desulfurase [Thermotogota bacterium]MDD8052465.1 cysteine desulfurase family protein [Thermotogota bacterium]